jgi:hypothetical protein
MAKVWVLDTETKGTGAEMVPLDKALERKRSAPASRPASVLRRRPASAGETVNANEHEPVSKPPRFRVVNVITQQVLGEDVPAAEVIELLRGVRSVIDVHIFIREPETGDWRPLTFSEKKVAWARSRP